MYLPSNYVNSQQSYPVLYLQDAQNLFDRSTSFSGEWRIDETLDSLDLELIVIGIEHGNEKRIDELTPFPHPEHHGGNAVTYLKFITETLKPDIDKRFRTKTDVSNTFIGGSSLGGLFSYFALLKDSEIFGKALVFSPSFWFSDKIVNFTDEIPGEKLDQIKLYFRAGKKENETMVPLMCDIKQQLLRKGLKSNQIILKRFQTGNIMKPSGQVYFLRQHSGCLRNSL
ncbi:MAG TPA: alpha/beta hydrolase-fold protein [Gillisia sp.]|nr:alpha/beta hydrolase-fold protein [Gillisia sp.]